MTDLQRGQCRPQVEQGVVERIADLDQRNIAQWYISQRGRRFWGAALLFADIAQTRLSATSPGYVVLLVDHLLTATGLHMN